MYILHFWVRIGLLHPLPARSRALTNRALFDLRVRELFHMDLGRRMLHCHFIVAAASGAEAKNGILRLSVCE